MLGLFEFLRVQIKVRNRTIADFERNFFTSPNFNKLSIKYQLFPKSTKIDALDKKYAYVMICNNPIN